MAGFTVVVRDGAKVAKRRFDALEAAVDFLEFETRALAQTRRRRPVDLKVRRFDPIQQVAVRGEIRGVRVAAGVDVRGDGSAEAFTGRLRKQPLAPEASEDAWQALRRVLGA